MQKKNIPVTDSTNLPDAEIHVCNLKITAIENNIIYGTVDVIFNSKHYRATYSYCCGDCADIEGLLDLETNLYSISGAYLLDKYCRLAEIVIIEYIEDNLLLNKNICSYIISLENNSIIPL